MPRAISNSTTVNPDDLETVFIATRRKFGGSGNVHPFRHDGSGRLAAQGVYGDCQNRFPDGRPKLPSGLPRHGPGNNPTSNIPRIHNNRFGNGNFCRPCGTTVLVGGYPPINRWAIFFRRCAASGRDYEHHLPNTTLEVVSYGPAGRFQCLLPGRFVAPQSQISADMLLRGVSRPGKIHSKPPAPDL